MLPAPQPPTLSGARSEGLGRLRTKADDETVPDLRPLAVGSVVAETYELRGLLGSGGLGQVFEAHDLRLDRRVAVKVARPAASEALRTEGRTLGAVKHPSIVAVFHAGMQQGFDYLVLEHISGPSLRGYLDERKRDGAAHPIGAAVALLRAIAKALAVVHQAGLSHRDLKPENVMLPPGDSVVLTDFGLARPEFAQANEHMSGSPDYMAPEVVTRTVRRGAGYLVDLYALGIVAYELLVGRTPFERGHWTKTLNAHVTQPPPDLRELRSDGREALAHL